MHEDVAEEDVNDEHDVDDNNLNVHSKPKQYDNVYEDDEKQTEMTAHYLILYQFENDELISCFGSGWIKPTC